MKYSRSLWPLLALVACLGLVTWSCTSGGPTGPSPVDSAVSGNPTPGTPTESPAPGACSIKDLVAEAVNFTSETEWPAVARVRLSNPTGTSCTGIKLTVWNANDQQNQVFFADSESRFPPSNELSVQVPCGVRVQLDVNNSPYTPEKGQYSPGYFVKAWWGNGPACAPPPTSPTPPPPPPPPPGCSDYTPPTIAGDISSDTQATQVVFSRGTVAPMGGAFSPALPATVARPEYGQPAGSFSTVYTLPYGPEGLRCSVSRPFTKPVPPKDPPPRTCGDVHASVSCTVNGNDATCTATWVNPGSGSIKLDSHDWQVIANGGSQTYIDLPAGSHTAHLRVYDGTLTCEDAIPFIIEGGSVCNNAPATSNAAQPFSLPNSSPTTETAWVNANVSPGPYSFSYKNDNGGPQCLPAASAAKVVLLKAGTNYWYFLNVQVGQQLCSNGQNISHLSYFVCAAQ